MGNCSASQQHPVSWADDGEWEVSSEEGENEERKHTEVVTIRITKKQLQELLEKAGNDGRKRRSAEQLMADIMNAGEVRYQLQREAHWKPALQSIPEAVES